MRKITISIAILFLCMVCLFPSATVFAEGTTPARTEPPQEGSLPVGVIFCLAAGVAVLAGGVSAFVMSKKKNDR